MPINSVNISIGAMKRQFFRRENTSDQNVFDQIFYNHDYNITRLDRGKEIIGHYNKILTSGKQPLIVDAGANIGAATVFFKGCFPASHVVAVEPEAGNFAMLLRNTEGLDVENIHGALTSAPGCVTIVDPNVGHWGYQTAPVVADKTGGNLIPCVTIRQLYEKHNKNSPFIVKIDIEGGEENLFAADTDWVEKTPLIIIELHDCMMPGKALSRNFLKCVSSYDRDFVYIGENVFSISNMIGDTR